MANTGKLFFLLSSCLLFHAAMAGTTTTTKPTTNTTTTGPLSSEAVKARAGHTSYQRIQGVKCDKFVDLLGYAENKAMKTESECAAAVKKLDGQDGCVGTHFQWKANANGPPVCGCPKDVPCEKPLSVADYAKNELFIFGTKNTDAEKGVQIRRTAGLKVVAGEPFIPEVLYKGKYYPICEKYWNGHNTNYGKNIVCDYLGFRGAESKTTHLRYSVDAMPVYGCPKKCTTLDCCNNGKSWGDFGYKWGTCLQGNGVGIQVTCTSPKKTAADFPYSWTKLNAGEACASGDDIESADECEIAAANLKFKDTTVYSYPGFDGPKYPHGCYVTSGGSLDFNKNTANKNKGLAGNSRMNVCRTKNKPTLSPASYQHVASSMCPALALAFLLMQ